MERVFFRDRSNLTSLTGVRSSKNAAGGIDRMVCSNNKVKSKFERQPRMTGPKRSSFSGSHLNAMTALPTGTCGTRPDSFQIQKSRRRQEDYLSIEQFRHKIDAPQGCLELHSMGMSGLAFRAPFLSPIPRGLQAVEESLGDEAYNGDTGWDVWSLPYLRPCSVCDASRLPITISPIASTRIYSAFAYLLSVNSRTRKL